MNNTTSNQSNNSDKDQKFLSRVSDALDKSCDSIDGYTQSRLTTIRHQALERAQPASSKWKLWVPASTVGLACCMLLVVNFGLKTEFNSQLGSQSGSQLNSEEITVSGTALGDLDLLTSEEGIEFFENFEFYQWLAENDLSV